MDEHDGHETKRDICVRGALRASRQTVFTCRTKEGFCAYRDPRISPAVRFIGGRDEVSQRFCRESVERVSYLGHGRASWTKMGSKSRMVVSVEGVAAVKIKSYLRGINKLNSSM